MAMIFDPQVYPYMKAALACIEEELDCQGVGACRYDALITAQEQLDGCDCCGEEHARLGRDGRVWARAVSINSIEGPTNIPNCPPRLVAEINFGISRCAVTGEELPSTGELEAQAVRGYADMHAMRMALTKCEPRRFNATLGQWTPLGPSGGCYGGIWSVQLQLT